MNHLFAILALPFMVTIIIPAIILNPFTSLNIGWKLDTPMNFLPPIIGTLIIATGLGLMAMTISMFAAIGKGTLAPWDPPKRLVVRGVYRHVRNPMISGVMFVLLGEAIFFGSIPLFVWFGVFALINASYIPFVEEPSLEKRFGDDYRLYKKNVPRWIPRLKAWGMSNIEKEQFFWITSNNACARMDLHRRQIRCKKNLTARFKRLPRRRNVVACRVNVRVAPRPRGDEVEWIDAQSAECVYCGGVIQTKE